MLFFSACLAALLSGAPESAVGVLSRECLVAVDARGALVFAVPGGADHVDLPPGIDAILRTPGAAITLRHNHPHSQGLSEADLMTLTASGVSVIEAVARDGSVYRASRGPHFDIRRVGRVYRELDVLAAVYFSLEWFQVADRARLRAETDHFACVALADAGVIGYAGHLSPAQSALLDHYAARVSLVQRWAAAAAVRTER
jgi:hypothetical protein